MITEHEFLDEIVANPSEVEPWLIFADWLDERGDPRGELVRLRTELTRHIDVEDRDAKEARMRHLLYVENLDPVNVIVENSIGMKFALIPPGEFLMGSPETEDGREEDETQHRVKLTQPFLMGVHPVTQSQYESVMGVNPSCFCANGDGKDEVAGLDTGKFPIETVSWNDCVQCCEQVVPLPDVLSHSFKSITLPTDAQWEFACRAGTTTPFHFGSSLSSEQANFNGNYPLTGDSKSSYLERPSIVGSFQANPFGLFDLHGNVWEWIRDGQRQYTWDSIVDPVGSLGQGADRVLRGGSWRHSARYVRSAYRYWYDPGLRFSNIGFRCVAVQEPVPPGNPPAEHVA